MNGFDRTERAIIAGIVTGARPEIGVLNGPSGGCTGTLVAPRWVLTAAHCVGFSVASPQSYTFTPGSGTGTAARSFSVEHIVSFGPPGPVTGDLNTWALTHLNPTADGSGNNDLALLALTTPVPSDLVPSPAAIATTLPANGSTVTNFGYGCTNFVSQQQDGQKRAASWTFGTHPDGLFASANGFIVNANGARTPFSGSTASPAFVTGGRVCPGDSGGPAVTGGLTDLGAIWGVNSLGAGPVLQTDEFGAVAYLHTGVCTNVFSPKKHGVCSVGHALDAWPEGCQSSLRASDVRYHVFEVQRAVCAEDPYCCDPAAGSWDDICVAEAKTAMGVHDRCVVGPPAPPAPAAGAINCSDSCYDSICAADVYCCTEEWDARCVQEVTEVCGLQCP